VRAESSEATAGALATMLRGLKLSTMHAHAEAIAAQAVRESWSYERYLHTLCELELSERGHRRIERNLRASGLPGEKTLATLDRTKLPVAVARQLPALSEGSWVSRGENLLIFGLPGRGKTHVVCALGHELVQRGRRVLFTQTFALVQRLLIAKRDLRLQKELRELDGYDVVILDDLGYVQQSREEMEVLFTFLAERYERKSVAITSNLVFSEWGRIFKDEMTTAAAIDRVVHHATIVEMTNKSVRAEQASEALRTVSKTATTTPTTTTPTTTTPTTITPEKERQNSSTTAAQDGEV
jgi:DNA replication protein DnaC